GDLLAALPGAVAASEDVQEELDRGEVDDCIVTLLLDLGQRLPDLLTEALAGHPASPFEARQRRELAAPLAETDEYLLPQGRRDAGVLATREERRRLGAHRAVREVGPRGEPVGDGEEARHARTRADGMMAADRLDDGRRQAPRLEDPAADLGVVDSEARRLQPVDRLDLARTADDAPVLVPEAHREHEAADVVQQARGEAFVRIARAQASRESLRRHRHRDRVRPELVQPRPRDA